jgi:hypothetical protein
VEFYPGINGCMAGLSSMEETVFKQNREGSYCKVKQFRVHPCFITEASNKRFDLCLLQL